MSILRQVCACCRTATAAAAVAGPSIRRLTISAARSDLGDSSHTGQRQQRQPSQARRTGERSTPLNNDGNRRRPPQGDRRGPNTGRSDHRDSRSGDQSGWHGARRNHTPTTGFEPPRQNNEKGASRFAKSEQRQRQFGRNRRDDGDEPASRFGVDRAQPKAPRLGSLQRQALRRDSGGFPGDDLGGIRRSAEPIIVDRGIRDRVETDNAEVQTDYEPVRSREWERGPSRGAGHGIDQRGRRGERGEERQSKSLRAQFEEGGDYTISRDRRGKPGTDVRTNRKSAQESILQSTRIPKPKKKDEVKTIQVQEEKKVFIPSSVSVGRLADILGVKIFNMQQTMRRLGMEEAQRRADYLLTSEDACNIALDYKLDPVVDDEAAFDIFPEPEKADTSSLPLRPPVVTIMGHVDHGKTTLLDNLRHSAIAKGEAGGITQHIGAFSVPLSTIMPAGHVVPAENPGSITFLDTPGHAAFTGMRARGASATDLVVLVVAADDGVMPQTKEVIELVKSAGDAVGMVVAINKCDKPGIDFDKVKSALGSEGVLVEEDGGDVPAVRVSGQTGLGLDQLVETLSTLAEMRELRARKEGNAEGIVLESKVDRGRGNVATILVQKGTLHAGSCIVAGTTWARVRQMQDSAGRPLRSAGPGTPVSLTGWKDLPSAGDQLLQALDEDSAKRATNNRLRDVERKRLLSDVESINEKRQLERKRVEQEEEALKKLQERGASDAEIAAFHRDAERRASKGEGIDGGGQGGEGQGGKKELRLVIKADVSGTVEAVVGCLEGIGNKEAGVKVVHTGVGEVGESDVHLADATDASIIAFSVPVSKPIQTLARSSSVPLFASDVIYRLVERVTADVVALLPPLRGTRVTGEATVQQVFEIKLKGKEILKIAGSRVSNGVVEMKEGVGARVMRVKSGGVEGEREVVYEGTIAHLKHLKKDVEEVRKGTECGIGLKDFDDIREGDEIVTFVSFDVPRTL